MRRHPEGVIIVLLRCSLGFESTALSDLVAFLGARGCLFKCRVLGIRKGVQKHGVNGTNGISAVEEVKWALGCCQLHHNIVVECDVRQNDIPIVMLHRHVKRNHVGESAVETFCETIRLRMISDGRLVDDHAHTEDVLK